MTDGARAGGRPRRRQEGPSLPTLPTATSGRSPGVKLRAGGARRAACSTWEQEMAASSKPSNKDGEVTLRWVRDPLPPPLVGTQNTAGREDQTLLVWRGVW